MTQAVSIIKSEHSRVRRILMMLTELRQDLEQSTAQPDAVLFRAIFEYLGSYERMHYPKEEKYLFQALRLRLPRENETPPDEVGALLDRLCHDHQQSTQWIKNMDARLNECLEGGLEQREVFLRELAHFVHLTEKHMDMEEQRLLPAAMDSLTTEDWQAVDEGFLHYDHLLDPLLGEAANVDFNQLYSRVIHYAPEPLGGLGLKHGDPAADAALEHGLGADGGLNAQYGHVRALDGLSEADWQAINQQYLHYGDPHFGRIVKDEIRQLHNRLAYTAPAPIGLGMAPAKLPENLDRVLEIRGLKTHYGRIQALNGIDLDIDKGELVALVGSNGAGKTTLLRTIAGLQRPSAGGLKFGGQDITRVRADRRVKLGISLIPEGRQVFGPLSVEDNLRLGAYTRIQNEQVARDMEQMYTLFPILKQKRLQAAGTLSGGQQQMLAMARALMARPQLLLLDEPSMGLAPLLVEEIFNTVGELKRRGITIFLVEQNAAAALAIADRGYVIETGDIVLSGPGQALLQDDKVKEAYLGH
ncbi:MAG: ATP-binding cassette domain-containing protein [Gammaproteobacteria bacterium]|nr:ATP-binding cassette domain-containing protein [Gammaproteobacteria bacterium]MCP5423517.1 ATP-binding cassette domain-containing protein [Gammaproteobacteria bacterium]